MIRKPADEIHQKGWGREEWHFNTDSLCVKTLGVDPGKWCSLHFHVDKEEIFLVNSGMLCVEHVDTKTGKVQVTYLRVGEMVLIERLTPHRFTAIGEVPCIFTELSTHHEDGDSYRVMPGATQLSDR